MLTQTSPYHDLSGFTDNPDHDPTDKAPLVYPGSAYLSGTGSLEVERDLDKERDTLESSAVVTPDLLSYTTQRVAAELSTQLRKAQEMVFNFTSPVSPASSATNTPQPDTGLHQQSWLVNKTINESRLGSGLESGLGNFSPPWDATDTSLHSTSTSFPGYIDIKNFSFDLDHHLKELDFFSNFSDCWNSSSCWGYNDTNTTHRGGGILENVEKSANYWVLLLLIFPIFTVFGNVLVTVSVYRERTLHTVTNYFIVSLAIADIMVGILVMPLAVYVEVSRHFLFI